MGSPHVRPLPWYSTVFSETPHQPWGFSHHPPRREASARAYAALSSTCLLHTSARASTIGATDQFPRSGSLPMSSEESVTPWLRRLKAGDRGAAEPLWRVYCHRLMALARARLRDAPRRA